MTMDKKDIITSNEKAPEEKKKPIVKKKNDIIERKDDRIFTEDGKELLS